MVEILPFKGYRYCKEKVGSFEKAISPPYDVMDMEMLQELHSNPYNVSHIIKGEKKDSDTSSNNQYTRAAEYLKKWIQEGVLVRDEKPCIYVLSQEFEVLGKKLARTGFIALIKLEDFCKGGGEECVGVHQHEETLPKDIEDRLSLLRATEANFGQIFCIYTDSDMTVDKLLAKFTVQNPLLKASDDQGVTHKLWKVDDPGDIGVIQKVLANRPATIADGHHRYKTAYKYSQESNLEGAQYRMLTFVNTYNEGLVVLPTHRLVQNLENFSAQDLLEKLSEHFAIETFTIRSRMLSRMKQEFNEGKHAFGLYVNDGTWYVLTLKSESVMDGIQGRSDAWRKLDVTILHQLILDNILGIDKEKLNAGTIGGGSFVEYIKDVGDAVERAVDKVNNQGYQALFFINPTRVEEVEAVANNHETMPQKSTFFYPKVWTGYVINKVE